MRTAVRNGLPPLPDDPAERISIEFSCPRFMVDEYIERFGTDFTRDMLSAKSQWTVVRAQHPFTKRQIIAELTESGIESDDGAIDAEAIILKTGVDVSALPAFREGRCTVQSESAMLACRAMMAENGMNVLDCCCAPGGKSAFISSLMTNTGHITAWELHEHRCKLTENTFERLHVTNAEVSERDATVHDEAFDGKFDAVLVDAPCSGFGVTGKPDVRLNRKEQDIIELADIQRRILDSCAEYVVPGGRLVYATCTVSYRENELQTEDFLKNHEDFVPASADWLNGAITDRIRSGGVQLFPNIDGTEGFYVAAFCRKG